MQDLIKLATELVKPMRWTEDKVLKFAKELEKRPYMFTDSARENVKLTIATLLETPLTQFYDIMDGGGVFWLNPVFPGVSGTCHVLLWAKDALGKPELGMIAMFDAFVRFNLNRLQAFIPAFNRLACRYAEACGMMHEGTMRRAMVIGGKIVDVNVYALLKEEIDDAFTSH